MPTDDLAARLDRATHDRRLLDHPFYRAWVAGSLTQADLAFYATQYWRQVEAFPGFLESLAGRLNGRASAIVTDNLFDERDGDHPGLWRSFAAALGVEDVGATAPEPETERCVGDFAAVTASASPSFALGMIYGYESQTPEVAATKVAGLREHYGIDGPGIAYFEIHGELDVAHARGLAEAIAAVADDDEALADAEAGARAGAEAIYGLLDGVARVRNISC
ncbi:MAG: iron-containing redox enzyme family protein [Actinomycetota bacterium]